MKDIKLVNGEDWQGLYIDDVLVAQNHSLDAEDVLWQLKIENPRYEVNEDWLAEQGTLPEKFEDVELADA